MTTRPVTAEPLVGDVEAVPDDHAAGRTHHPRNAVTDEPERQEVR
jgi:hypothetical protein